MLEKIGIAEPTELYKEISPDLLYLIEDDNKLIDYYNNIPSDSPEKKLIWDYLILHFSGVNKKMIDVKGLSEYLKDEMTVQDEHLTEELYGRIRERVFGIVL